MKRHCGRGWAPVRGLARHSATVGVALFALLGSLLVAIYPANAAVGLRVSGRNIVEASGGNFIPRGTSHAHTWFSSQTSSFANIKSLGADGTRHTDGVRHHLHHGDAELRGVDRLRMQRAGRLQRLPGTGRDRPAAGHVRHQLDQPHRADP